MGQMSCKNAQRKNINPVLNILIMVVVIQLPALAYIYGFTTNPENNEVKKYFRGQFIQILIA